MIKRYILTLISIFIIVPTATGASNLKKFSRKSLFDSVKKHTKSYDSCLKSASKNLKISKKKTKASLQKYKKEVQACKERYPAADHYKKCKKQALKLKPNNAKAARIELKSCKNTFISSTKVEKSNFPVFLNQKENEVIFAGVGIEKKLTLKTLSPPGFECYHAKEVTTNVSDPIYALLGNDIKIFINSKLPTSKIAKKLKIKPTKNNPGEFEDKDLIRYIKTKSGMTVYFPLISCSLENKGSDIYEDIKLYYIFNKKSGTAIPYFGVAFYKSETTKFISQKLSKVFGEQFISRQKSPAHTVYFADNIKEFDDNSDPYNICKYRKNHKFLAFTQNNAKNSEKIAYLLLANIENLCEYGDRHFSRLK